MVPAPEDRPVVPEKNLETGEAHFVSKFREYSVLITTEPDVVTPQGHIVKGKNKSIRFRDFHFVTRDRDVIAKLRGLGRGQYGLGCEVWEKYQQDEELANKAIAMAESAIDSLPPEKQQEMLQKLQAKFDSFKLPPRGSVVAEDGDTE